MNQIELINKPEKRMFTAMIKGKCPRCRMGNVFPHAAYSFGFHKMNDNCAVCKQDFIIEPGFYYGAMYFSYGNTVAIVVGVVLALKVFIKEPDEWMYITAITIALFAFSQPIFRLSRLMMLYFFGSVKYDQNAAARSFKA